MALLQISQLQTCEGTVNSGINFNGYTISVISTCYFQSLSNEISVSNYLVQSFQLYVGAVLPDCYGLVKYLESSYYLQETSFCPLRFSQSLKYYLCAFTLSCPNSRTGSLPFRNFKTSLSLDLSYSFLLPIQFHLQNSTTILLIQTRLQAFCNIIYEKQLYTSISNTTPIFMSIPSPAPTRLVRVKDDRLNNFHFSLSFLCFSYFIFYFGIQGQSLA